MMIKFQRFVVLSYPILGLLLALTPKFLFPVCYDGSYMDCWGAGLFVMLMGLVIEFLNWYINLGVPPLACNILSLVPALMAILVPYRIIALDSFMLCDDASHACRTSTMPAVIVIASLIIILNVVCAAVNLYAWKKR